MRRYLNDVLSVEHIRLVLAPGTDMSQRRGFPSWNGDNYVVRQREAVRDTYPSIERLRRDWPELASLALD